jgi:hypothetical protein
MMTAGPASATAIDPWAGMLPGTTRTRFPYNDRLEDVLVSHLQPGDPADGGYSCVQMQDTLLNLRFNVLQLSRRIPLGLQAMYLTRYIEFILTIQ